LLKLLLLLLFLFLFVCVGALLQSTELPVAVTPRLLLASASASARQICLDSGRQQHGYA
jgi:hypothetical protein